MRRRQFRVYPKQFVSSPGDPSMFCLGGSRLEGNGFPGIFNIEADPREENNRVATACWLFRQNLKVVL